jgi:nitrous oxidase accessory protein
VNFLLWCNLAVASRAMKIPPPIIPKEHGAWAVLFVPMIVGAGVADRFSLNAIYLGLSALAMFLSYVPVQTILRQLFIAPQGPNKFRPAIFWATVDLTLGALFIFPLALQKLWLLAGFALLGGLFFLANFILTRRYAKTIFSDLMATLGLTLSAPSAYYAVTGRLDQNALLLWLLNFLFFGCGMVYVHMKIRASATKKPELSFDEILGLGKFNLVYHAVVLAIVGFLAIEKLAPLFAVLAFVPMTMHAVYGTFKLSGVVRFKNLGLLLLAQSIVFALLFVMGAALIFAQSNVAPPDAADKMSALRLSAAINLQSQINAARRGDTIFVAAGIYHGNLVVDKKLTLIGHDWPVIRGEGKGSVITITADSCVLNGFVIEHCGKMLVHEDAGILIKSSYNQIEGNKLRDVLFGIYLLHAQHNLVADNNIVGRKQLEVGERGSGMHIWNSQRNRFIGNVITEVRDGFYIQYANHTVIEHNEAFNLRYGLHYMYADSNVFLHNKFHDNTAGAAIMYSRGIVMRRNTFVHNRGFASFGILFQDCHNAIADSNIIADNVIGMFFEASTNNFFRHNIIAQNDVALQMFQNSERNTFTENNFIDNLNPLALVGKRTLTHWNENNNGNYWSAYDGYDLDGNGIGDIPMKIQNVFDYLEGRYPNLRLYLYSPASQALAVAAKAFPIIEINQEADERPLMRPVDLKNFRIIPTD